MMAQQGTPPEQPAPGRGQGRYRWIWWAFALALVAGIWYSMTDQDGTRSEAAPPTPTPTRAPVVRAPTPTPRPQTVTVRYYVEPHRSPGVPGQPAASITYTNAQGGIEQIAHYPGPWDLVFEARPGTIVSVSAQNRLDHGKIICRIYLNGQLWKESESVGGYTIATCSGVVGFD